MLVVDKGGRLICGGFGIVTEATQSKEWNKMSGCAQLKPGVVVLKTGKQESSLLIVGQ
jgi:hypothetical protein